MRDTTKVVDMDAKYRPYHWEEDYTSCNQFMFAIEYDRLNVVDVAEDFPNMTADVIKHTIECEGGTVDEFGNISKGSAKYTFAKADEGEYIKLDEKMQRIRNKRDMRALVLQAAQKFKGDSFAKAFFWVLDEKEKRDRKNDTVSMWTFTKKDFVKQLEKYFYYVKEDMTIGYSIFRK